MTECWRRGYQAPTTRLVPCITSLLPLNGQHPVYIQTSNLDPWLVKAATITTLQTQLHQTMVGLIRTTTAVTSRHSNNSNNSNRTPSMTKESLHHHRHMPRPLSSFNSHNNHNSPTQTWARIRAEQHRTLVQPTKSLLRLSSSVKCRTRHTLRSLGLLIHRKHLRLPYRTLRVRASIMETAIQHSHPSPLCNGPPASPHSHPSRRPHNYTPALHHSRHPSPRLRPSGKMRPILPNKREHRHRNKHLRNSNHHHNNNTNRSRSSRSHRNNSSSSSGSSPTSSSNPLCHGNRRRTQPAGMAPKASRLRHRTSCWCSQKS
jgi:hypothetical protein